MKKCYKCGIEKDLSEFHNDKTRKDGHKSSCKKCAIENTKKYYRKNKDSIKDYYSVYNIENKDIISEKKKIYNSLNKKRNKERHKEWYLQNRDIYVEKQKEYYKENREDILIYQESYRSNNKEKINMNKREYYNKNKHIFIWRGLLKRLLYRKDSSTEKILGYSFDNLKKHIENQFLTGMNWENHGEWHIDHIIPVKSFKKDVHPSIVNALSNLRPLWATTREINGVIYEGNLNRKKNYEI